MEISFEDIGKFIADKQLWFLVPFIIAMTGLFIGLVINVALMKKRRKKHERHYHARSHRSSK